MNIETCTGTSKKNFGAKNFPIGMSGCQFCTAVSPDTKDVNLKRHMDARHDVFSLDHYRSLKAGEKEMIVDGQKFSYYRLYDEHICTVCDVTARSVSSIGNHFKRKHVMTWQEKQEEKLCKDFGDEKPYCDICWLRYATTKRSNIHQTVDVIFAESLLQH